MNTSQIFSILDQLSKMHAYTINFTGGESLARDDIRDIVSYTKRKGIRACISTNGLLVQQKIKEIKSIDFIIISYDGPEQVHNIQRQEGTYPSVVNAMEIARKYDIKIRLHTVLTRYNIKHIDSILEFARMFNAIVNFSIIEVDPASEKENARMLPPVEEYKKALRYLIMRKRKGDKNIGNTHSGLLCLSNWPQDRNITCCAGKIYCRIEPNGDLYPCTNLISKQKPANCIKEGFKKAFERLHPEKCNSCWCDTRVELNNIYSLNLNSILSLRSSYNLR